MSQSKGSKELQVTVQSINSEDRIDYQFFDPKYFEIVNHLEKISQTKQISLIPLKQLLFDSKHGITGGATPLGAAYLTEGIPFIRVQNVRRTGLDLSDVVFIARQIHEGELKRSQLIPKDVLLTITGVTYGIATVVPESLDVANINQHVVRIRVNQNEIIPEFLALYLNSKFGRIQTDRNVTGGSRPALDYICIKKLLILKPELTVQEEIVKATQKIQQEATLIKKQMEQLESVYDEIILSKFNFCLPHESKLKFFLSQVDEQDRLEVKWFYPFFDELISKIRANNSRRIADYNHELRYGASLYADYVSDTPFLRIENLERNYFDLSDLQYVPNSVYRSEINNLYLQKDDILIARSGSVGLCAYVKEGLETYVYGSYIIRLRTMDSRILPEYLSVYLNSILGRLQFERQKTGSLQFNINIEQIRDLWIIEPAKSFQEEIAKEVFGLVEDVNGLRMQYKQKLKQAEDLFENMLEIKS